MIKWIFALLLVAGPALAQHEHHPEDLQLHNDFYQNWRQPDNHRVGCCNEEDCYSATIKREGDVLFAQRREDQRWLMIPQDKIDTSQDSPDGRSHVCIPPPDDEYDGADGGLVYCFILGYTQ